MSNNINPAGDRYESLTKEIGAIAMERRELFTKLQTSKAKVEDLRQRLADATRRKDGFTNLLALHSHILGEEFEQRAIDKKIDLLELTAAELLAQQENIEIIEGYSAA